MARQRAETSQRIGGAAAPHDTRVAPGSDPHNPTGRHTHPGEELTYVREGQLELRIDGQPPRVILAGETLHVPAGVVHEGVNAGDMRTKLLATDIVEKGPPLAQPVKYAKPSFAAQGPESPFLVAGPAPSGPRLQCQRGVRPRRRAANTRTATPDSMSAQVPGSGTACTGMSRPAPFRA